MHLEVQQIQRVIGTYGTADSGPVFFVIGGMHGNEPSGILAAQLVLQELASCNIQIRGQLHCLAGNVAALTQGVRFVDRDLNRMWADDYSEDEELCSEHLERKELIEYIHANVGQRFDSVWALDLHTTSGDTSPFVTIDDALPNRAFAQCAGAPIILGIEEHVHGSILEFFNENGATVIGFEGGQHVSMESVHNHRRVVYSALCEANMTSVSELQSAGIDWEPPSFPANGQYFEIVHRHALNPHQESFLMHEGYASFQRVQKGEVVAANDGKDVIIEKTGYLLMPLYQRQGSEGYFLIAGVSSFWLKLSTFVRRVGAYRFLWLLPGVSRGKDDRELLVNVHIARFFPVALMHLFGYRRRTEVGQSVLRFTKRRDG